MILAQQSNPLTGGSGFNSPWEAAWVITAMISAFIVYTLERRRPDSSGAKLGLWTGVSIALPLVGLVCWWVGTAIRNKKQLEQNQQPGPEIHQPGWRP